MTILQEDIERIISADLPWHELDGANVLVSGAAGFLPACMVDTLIRVNAKVTVLGRDSVQKRFSGYGVKMLIQDVCDPVFGYYEYVIHAASICSPTRYKSNPVETLLANTRGTQNMLNACSGKFLYFSSGDAAHCPDTLDVRSCYGESKRMGEVMCTAWKSQYGLDTKIARISHTYGPGMKMDDGRVFADFVRDIRNGGPIVMHSDGSAVRPFLYLADATVAFFTILLKGSGAYNVANPYENVSIRELAHRLSVEFGVAVEYRSRTDSAYMPSTISGDAPDISALQSLGWKPATTIEEGFRRTVASYDPLP
jgi:UDP-glucuronate decarboxylase